MMRRPIRTVFGVCALCAACSADPSAYDDAASSVRDGADDVTDVPPPMDGRGPWIDVPAGDAATAAGCQALLRTLGVEFTVAPATMGVAMPVTVTTPINDVHFHPSTLAGTERALLMDCRLAVALEATTRALRDRWQVTDVAHLGIYNYRCIAGSDPCIVSQHAHALAIDLAALRDRAGRTYTVLTDFVANGSPTCPPRATGPVDQLLKDFACWMYDSRTFTIILTPNYNADHRDHFHVDLTSGSHFIGIEPPSGVDPEVPPALAALWVDDD
jgi:hypothetical protein